ncbi:MAG: hypothetical protein ABIP37_06925 [Methylotenera sp.]
MLLQCFKGASVLALGTEGMVLRPAGSNDQRILCTGNFSPENLLDELEGQAQSLALKRVRFVLSNQLVRYIVQPWQPGVYAKEDWHALATHQFRIKFGPMVENWDVQVTLQGYGKPLVACAIDKSFRSRLLTISANANWLVQGICPALMAVFNHYRKHLGSEHWLLLVEQQRLLLGQISQGMWRQFYVEIPLKGDEAIACQQMVERVLRFQGGGHPTAISCFGHASLLPSTFKENLQIIRLPLPSMVASNGLDLLAGVA